MQQNLVELTANQEQGWRASTRTSYLFEYAIEHMDLRDGHALSFQFPVNVQNSLENQWPAFLMDLLPQGYGRKELLNHLSLSINAEEQADGLLLKSGGR